MGKSVLFLALLFFCVGCNHDFEVNRLDTDTATTRIVSYDFLKYEYGSDFEIIDIDSLENYSALLEEMERLTCEGKTTGLQFQYRDTIYGLIGYRGCPDDRGVGCYGNVNSIFIKNDSLENYSGDWDTMVHISNLDKEIEKIKAVDYHFQSGKNMLNPAVIELFIDDRYPISKTKEVLREITEQFQKINSEMGVGYFSYNVLFVSISWLDIPPPPPPPPGYELGELP